MDPLWFVGIALVILVTGAAAIFIVGRDHRMSPPQAPPSGLAEMGYGHQRWKRELALWQGTLRRLEIQARSRSSVPEGLQQQIDEAKARIAEAERHLGES